MILFGLEEFAAKRRTAQQDLEDAMRPLVAESVDRSVPTSGWDDLLSLVSRLYEETYSAEAGADIHGMPSRFREQLRQTLRKTKDRDENTVERITVWLATAILSRATIDAAVKDPEELFLEWVDMDDSHVRPAHREASGQVRPIGEKFEVGGQETEGPGLPDTDVDLWINCRCTLRPVLASEALVAAAFISDAPWDGSAGRFSTEQWKSSCILHVCDGMEKSCHKLPVKEPGGALSRAGVHAAASRIGQAQAPPEKIAAAKRALRGAYRQLGEEPPDSLTAGGSMDPVEETPGTGATDLAPIPWHGVLAPEGVRSGDGRRFKEGALRFAPVPLPLTWQKFSDDGHKQSVTFAKIEQIVRAGGEIRGAGHVLQSVPEADEVTGLIAEFGRFGVSVDADESTFELSEDEETVDFSDARIRSASVVPIPAFAEAWIALGEPPEGFLDGEEVVAEGEESEVPEEALVASGLLYMENAVQTFKDLAPGKTEDGPGWLTNPVDTDRLRDYWTRGAGAAKIGWGSPGDFNRCRVNLAQYVKPQYLNGYCANRHYDALGFWPGRPVSGESIPFAAETMGLTDTEPAPAVSLVASVVHTAPADWFANPNLTEPTHVTVTDEGRVFGHVAQWGVCHIGFQGQCVVAPESPSEYAYFLTKQVALDDGTRAATGAITLGGGHAGERLSMRAAIAHYDRTSTAVADVTVGQDAHGIWCAGWLRPGTNKDQATALMASDVSGDWRPKGDDLELVAVLAVNVGGFSTLRPRVAASGDRQLSLVAAGVLHREPETHELEAPFDVDALAQKVAAALEQRRENRERMAALAARINA